MCYVAGAERAQSLQVNHTHAQVPRLPTPRNMRAVSAVLPSVCQLSPVGRHA
jgi:hypothetical protein